MASHFEFEFDRVDIIFQNASSPETLQFVL